MTAIDASRPTQVARVFDVPVAGPHGLDLDTAQRRVFCACDGKKLVTLDAGTGHVLNELDISGVPDVIIFNAALKHLYVAIGDPGEIEVFDTDAMKRIEVVATEEGAHSIAFDVERNTVYAFLPQTHRASVYVDAG